MLASPGPVDLVVQRPGDVLGHEGPVRQTGELIVHGHTAGALFGLQARTQLPDMGAVPRDNVEGEAYTGEDDGAEQFRELKVIVLGSQRVQQPDDIQVHRQDEACRDEAGKDKHVAADLCSHAALGCLARLTIGRGARLVNGS